MAYQKNDKNNNAVSPQPGSSTVNHFSGNEGWALSLIHISEPTRPY